jgi:hypothetical protein
MKKIVLAVLATSMLLSNVAFASTNNTAKTKVAPTVEQNNVYNLETHDAQ